MTLPLMRKAVAVWLVDNTSLTFEQIADACGLHVSQVSAIADGEIAAGLVGCDPRATGEIDQQSIDECQEDPNKKLVVNFITQTKKKRAQNANQKVSVKRGVKPSAVLWLIQNYPQLSDAQIVKLIKTTAKIVKSIREKTYWNYDSLKPVDPALHNLYSQEDLDDLLLKIKIAEQTEAEMMNVENSMEDSL
jgi:hypothetical protein